MPIINYQPVSETHWTSPLGCLVFVHSSESLGASLMAKMIKNLPAAQEMWVQSLAQADSLEKEMATHSSILAWEIPRTEETGGLQSMGL